MTWYKNVKMETGYGDNKTLTKIGALEIKDGIIAQITETAPEGIAAIDARNYLLLPALKDNHIHLDKGFYGGPWQAVLPLASVQERIIEEEGFLIDFLEGTPEKAQALIDLVCGHGATFMRVQVNVDPVVGLQNYRIIRDVLDANKERLDYELVAFPQHGTLHSKESLLEVMQEKDLTAIGGLDPATIDHDIEASLTFIFENAKKYDKEFDIHLHDHGQLGLYEIERIIEYTHKYDRVGKVNISHAYALGDVSLEAVEAIAKKMAEAKMTLNTTVPIDTPAPPLYIMDAHGVKVHIINDNIHDHWSPFGSGDLIQRASRGAERFGVVDEVGLSQSLRFITENHLTPLDKEGKQQWPTVGSRANLLFIEAESSAHAIARIMPHRVVMKDGAITYGSFE